MKQNKTELIVGAFVLAGIVAIAWLAIKIGSGTLLGSGSWLLEARFANSGGINPGSSVIIAGVPVGRVESVRLDDGFNAIVTLRLQDSLKLPTDTMASIKTSGLIGDRYIALAPGGDDEFFKPGERITETEPAVDIESLISRFAFGSVDKKSPESGEAATAVRE
ncbi:ABC-type transport system involved in resistance to organic solvents, periplasmic component [Opitutaceae bacterium TAV1]|nr:ABC transporter substrate-binding protein [Opitutaceae bacterium TAV5]EIP96578.1 ABC-type transport system involved in resistance to organic solvents, periplasmic component [Opitutaceae bacterium TAV1]